MKLAHVVMCAALLAGCEREVPVADTFPQPALAITNFRVSTLTPVAGERVYFELAGDGLAVAYVYQGDVKAATFVSQGRPQYGMIDTLRDNPMFGSFIALNGSAPRVELWGAEGEKKLLDGEPLASFCDIDGTWQVHVTYNNNLGPAECAFVNKPPVDVVMRAVQRAAVADFNGQTVNFDGIDPATCRAVWRFPDATTGIEYVFQLTLNPDKGFNYQEVRTIAAGTCIDQWGGTAVRIAP